DWAAMAKLRLVQGDTQCARDFAEQVMGYLKNNPSLFGASHEIRTFRYTWDVWLALGEADKADQVLSLAAALIQDYLEENLDPDGQAMYLRQPHHAVLWAAWREKKAG
ncbi:MAG: hypothetical protein ACK2T5_10245, partial [Anaerolineales bacterium]